METEKNKRKRIKTSAVFGNAVRHVPIGKSQDYSLKDLTGVDAQNWHHYRTGKRNIGPSNLKRTAKLPGSLDTHDIGPDKVPLWAAIWSTDKIELWGAVKSTSEEVQIHKAITALNSDKRYGYDFTEMELDDADIYIKALIEYTEEILNYIDLTKNHPDQFQLKQISTTHNKQSRKIVNLNDLVALIAAYRFCDLFYFPRNIQHLDTINYCIQKLIDNEDIKNALKKYRVYDEVVQELSFDDHSTTSIPTINYEYLAHSIIYKLEVNGKTGIFLSTKTNKIGLGSYIYEKINKRQSTTESINNRVDLTELSADLYSILISSCTDDEEKEIDDFIAAIKKSLS